MQLLVILYKELFCGSAVMAKMKQRIKLLD